MAEGVSQAYADPAQGAAAERLAEEIRPAPAAQDLPLRQYMDSLVVPTLLPGLNALAEERPENPVEWLAYYLLKNNPKGKASSPGGDAAKAEGSPAAASADQ
mmetsp:Transcript_40577/g.101942  ORF Transcript_40577/g.101942 Transcript_40577/m.101942 type:complete len:102 (+) Transcript_40577:101-406(+)